jgi:protein-tyrosine phosphatase
MSKIHYADVHCHFLPGMDDGCKTTQESSRWLAEQYRQGCRGLVSTSHYYDDESIHSFLRRRQTCWDNLRQELDRRKGPNGASAAAYWEERVAFGAEVAYHSNLVNEPDLDLLCFGNSNYLLLEMPFRHWNSKIMRDVDTMTRSLGLNVIIAHIERFLDLAGSDYIKELMDMDVLVQVNAGNFVSFHKNRAALRLMKQGDIQVLGTDSHNLTTRPPNMEAAIQTLNKKFAANVQQILATNDQIWQEAL